MDGINAEAKKVVKGFRMGDEEIKVICYADDSVRVAEDEDNLQRLLYNFEQMAFNMKIYTTNTKSHTVSRKPWRCKFDIYNKSVEQFFYVIVQIIWD